MARTSHTIPNQNWVEIGEGPGIITIKSFGNGILMLNTAQEESTAMLIQPLDNESQIHISSSGKIYARATEDEANGWQLILHNEK